MNLLNYKEVNLLELVEIERAQKGKIYKKGNIIIQVSASRGQIFYLEKEMQVGSQYVVLSCKNINPKYLYYILEQELPLFLEKYQTGINIQIEVFKYLNLKIHSSLKTQEYISNILTNIDKQLKAELTQVDLYKEFKNWHLDKMFI